MTKAELIAFEDEVAELFNSAQIRSLIHLSHGNEDQMINVFKSIAKRDWVLCSWRSHYQCLLKGVPRDKVLKAIMQGKSIAMCFPEYKILSSGIAGGILPIGIGIAEGIKRNIKEVSEFVHCFIGEMTSEMGIFHECLKYASNHDLPIRFIIEDNGKSVCTDTRETWGQQQLTYEGIDHKLITRYTYTMEKWPHSGAGKRIEF
jgi:TPP-dependent pyruvate/acetoin dehydrogenase alpha subunit